MSKHKNSEGIQLVVYDIFNNAILKYMYMYPPVHVFVTVLIILIPIELKL